MVLNGVDKGAEGADIVVVSFLFMDIQTKKPEALFLCAPGSAFLRLSGFYGSSCRFFLGSGHPYLSSSSLFSSCMKVLMSLN